MARANGAGVIAWWASPRGRQKTAPIANQGSMDVREFYGQPVCGKCIKDGFGWGVMCGLGGLRLETLALGHHWLHMDNGYMGHGQYYRFAWDTFSCDGLGEWPEGYKRMERFNPNPRPWRKSGEHVLVVMQTEHWYKANCVPDWRDDTIKRLKSQTDRPIRVREKSVNQPKLGADLENCWALVTYESSACVQALQHGIPVFCDSGPGKCMSGTDIESPFYPDDRERWFAALAAQQWNDDEITKGFAWEWIAANRP